MKKFVSGTLGFWPDDGGDITTHSARDYDMRQPVVDARRRNTLACVMLAFL
jgi:hypothetical protein